jgi:hypothetical protein
LLRQQQQCWGGLFLKKNPKKMLVHGEKPAAAEPQMVRTFLLFQVK